MIRRLGSQDGQTMVEFAFILPLFVVLIFAIAEFSLILYDRAMIINASREGARAGMLFKADPITGEYLPPTAAEITSVVNQYLANHLVTLGGSSTAATAVTGIGTRGETLQVTVTYRYTFLVLTKLLILGNTINFRAETRMRIE